MQKYYSSEQTHIPFRQNVLNQFKIILQPQRAADKQLLNIQNQIYLNYQSDEDIFEENVIEGKRVRKRKTKSSLFVQNSTLKKQNQSINKKNEELQIMLDQLGFKLKQKQIQLKHAQSSINDVTVTLKATQKRKSILQLQLSKIFNQLETVRNESQTYQKQISRMLKIIADKDSQIVDIMHRNSQQVKQIKQQHKQVIEQYQIKQQETKKLLKKLNSINQQKQHKIRQQAQGFKLNYEKILQLSKQQQNSIVKLSSDNNKLQQFVKNSVNKYEIDLVNMKSECDKMINNISLTKDNEINKILQQYKTEVNSKNNEIKELKQTITNQQIKYKNVINDKDKNMQMLTSQLNQKQRQFERIIILKDKDNQKLQEEVHRQLIVIENLELSNEELFTKNQTLEHSIKDVYGEITKLQSKFLQANKQKISLTNQNIKLKSQVKNIIEKLQTTEGKLSMKSMQLSKIESQLKNLKQSNSKLQQELKYQKNNLNALEHQYEQVSEDNTRQNNTNVQLRQMLLQKQLFCESLKEKYIKLQQFVENFKVDSDKMKQITEKKWYELRQVYENQIEQLEQKIVETQKKYNTLKLELEEVDRSNKIYQFENNMSPNIM